MRDYDGSSIPIKLAGSFIETHSIAQSKIIDYLTNEQTHGKKQESLINQAARLSENWINKIGYKDTSSFVIWAVESPWYIWLDEWTLLVGVMDAIMEDWTGIFGCEWKTTRTPTKFYTEKVWLEELVTGPQVAIYALALEKGAFYAPNLNARCTTFGDGAPRIRVRAAVKDNITIWPSPNYNDIFTYTERNLMAIENSVMNEAAAIRELRRRGNNCLPWQYPGKHCKQFGSYCAYLEGMCASGINPRRTGERKPFDLSDPGAAAIEYAFVETERDVELLKDDRMVVVSASAYQLMTSCREKYRIVTEIAEKETNDALELGGLFHGSLAAYYGTFKKVLV